MTRFVAAFAAVFPSWSPADIRARAKNTPLHTSTDSVLATMRPGKVVACIDFEVDDDAEFLIADPLGGPAYRGSDLDDVIDAGASDLPHLSEPLGIVLVRSRPTTPVLRLDSLTTAGLRRILANEIPPDTLPLNNFARGVELVFHHDHAMPPMRKAS